MLIFCLSETGRGSQNDFCLTIGRKWTHVYKHVYQVKNPLISCQSPDPSINSRITPFLVDFGWRSNTVFVKIYLKYPDITVYPHSIFYRKKIHMGWTKIFFQNSFVSVTLSVPNLLICYIVAIYFKRELKKIPINILTSFIYSKHKTFSKTYPLFSVLVWQILQFF